MADEIVVKEDEIVYGDNLDHIAKRTIEKIYPYRND